MNYTLFAIACYITMRGLQVLFEEYAQKLWYKIIIKSVTLVMLYAALASLASDLRSNSDVCIFNTSQIRAIVSSDGTELPFSTNRSISREMPLSRAMSYWEIPRANRSSRITTGNTAQIGIRPSCELPVSLTIAP